MGAFSIFTIKKNNKKKQPTPTVNEYYGGLAKRANRIMMLVGLLLVTFIIFSFTFYTEHLTIENLRYMLKFVEFDSTPVASNGTEIIFDNDLKSTGALIKGDIAVVDTNGLRIYDNKGQRIFRYSNYYTNPLTAYNGKNLIVCEKNTNSIKIFSSYSELHTANFAYPVLNICAAETGRYAVMTASKGFKSGFEVFDSNYRIIFYQYYTEKHTTSFNLSADGKNIAVCALMNSDKGEYVSTTYIYDVDDGSEQLCFTHNNEIPWNVQFTENGFVLITNKALRFYNKNGDILNEIFYGSKEPRNFEISDKYILVSYKSSGLGNATNVDIYTEKGSFVNTKNYQSSLDSVHIIDEYAYIYSLGTLYTINLTGQNSDKTDIIGYDFISLINDKENEQIIMFQKGSATIYNKTNFNSEALVQEDKK
ncbi:DUF5711 family protein [Eubacteriales bacterium OttesenSCG-928-G02]|nr:DUF5711 family protein [Eubacteriales bacterium OttesenSCG-928-G02]